MTGYANWELLMENISIQEMKLSPGQDSMPNGVINIEAVQSLNTVKPRQWSQVVPV